MAKLYTVVKKVIKLSREEYPDQVLVVYKRANNDYTWCLEAVYYRDEDKIAGKFLNGVQTMFPTV